MRLGEAGNVLLSNRNPNVTLGFVSAVQRGYDVCVSRALAAPSGDAAPASSVPTDPSASADASRSKRSAGYAALQDAGGRARSDSILARLDAEITQLKKGGGTSPNLSSSEPSSKYQSLSSGAGSAEERERTSKDVEASTPAQEPSDVARQLRAQNQALTDAMQQLREAAQASEERAVAAEARAAALEELVKEAERRAKASGWPVRIVLCNNSRVRGMRCESDPFALVQRRAWR